MDRTVKWTDFLRLDKNHTIVMQGGSTVASATLIGIDSESGHLLIENQRDGDNGAGSRGVIALHKIDAILEEFTVPDFPPAMDGEVQATE